MTAQELFLAIGSIEDRYIQEAEPTTAYALGNGIVGGLEKGIANGMGNSIENGERKAAAEKGQRRFLIRWNLRAAFVICGLLLLSAGAVTVLRLNHALPFDCGHGLPPITPTPTPNGFQRPEVGLCEKYPYLNWGGAAYTATGKTAESEQVGEWLADVSLYAPEQEGSTQTEQKKVGLYRLDGRSEQTAVAVLFAEEAIYYVYETGIPTPTPIPIPAAR